MTDQEKANRAWEKLQEAEQMALDLNQAPDMRRAWESRRDAAQAEYWELIGRLAIEFYFPGTLKENVAAGLTSGKPSARLPL